MRCACSGASPRRLPTCSSSTRPRRASAKSARSWSAPMRPPSGRKRSPPRGVRVGVLFGRERIGLTNEEVSLADEILTLPVDPAFGSLNVAQAVLIVAYEWRRATLTGETAGLPFARSADPPAPKDELIHLFLHLESALDKAGFFRPPEKRAHMVEALRNMLQRAGLSDQEVRTLRGVIAALERRPTRPRAASRRDGDHGAGQIRMTTRLLVFDSGIGGLSVAREIATLIPAAEMVYVADDAGIPLRRLGRRAAIGPRRRDDRPADRPLRPGRGGDRLQHGLDAGPAAAPGALPAALRRHRPRDQAGGGADEIRPGQRARDLRHDAAGLYARADRPVRRRLPCAARRFGQPRAARRGVYARRAGRPTPRSLPTSDRPSSIRTGVGRT